MNNNLLDLARQTYKRAAPELLQRKNVVATGLGCKVSNGERTDQLSLIVSVERKVPIEELPTKEIIPQAVNGIPTDVVETGRLRAQLPHLDTRGRHRPAMPGISIGHPDVTAGTFGLLVRRGSDLLILSNNHVLANTNAAEVGDPILQPGIMDGGTLDDAIATLEEFVALDLGEEPGECQVAEGLTQVFNLLAQTGHFNHRLRSVQQTPGKNEMDVALARPLSSDLVVPEILGLGLPTGVGVPALGCDVQKVGRTTGLLQGTVQQIDVTAHVEYNGVTVSFVDQVMTSRMSQPGDSGSAILDMDGALVGLLFAGSPAVTLFTPIRPILNRLNVEVITT